MIKDLNLRRVSTIMTNSDNFYHQEDGKQESMQDCRSDECNKDSNYWVRFKIWGGGGTFG